MKRVDLTGLNPEEKKELMKKLRAEERAAKRLKEDEKMAFDTIRDEAVEEAFATLEDISRILKASKEKIFDDFSALIDMKQKVHNISDSSIKKQSSHTLSTINGMRSIVLGHNMVDDWDKEIACEGVERVFRWIKSKIKDDNTVLGDIIRDLLKPTKDGVLNSRRVLELSKRAKDIGDYELIEAIEMIQSAYTPRRTSTYVKAKYIDKMGRNVWLQLSMSSID